jgi:hypothetical protein
MAGASVRWGRSELTCTTPCKRKAPGCWATPALEHHGEAG